MTRGPYSHPIRIHIDLERELTQIRMFYKQNHGLDISMSKASEIYYRETRNGGLKKFGL